jgi:hypothetical protein
LGEIRNKYGISVGKPEGKPVDVDGRIILRWMLKEQGVSVWTAYSWLRIWPSGGLSAR